MHLHDSGVPSQSLRVCRMFGWCGAKRSECHRSTAVGGADEGVRTTRIADGLARTPTELGPGLVAPLATSHSSLEEGTGGRGGDEAIQPDHGSASCRPWVIEIPGRESKRATGRTGPKKRAWRSAASIRLPSDGHVCMGARADLAFFAGRGWPMSTGVSALPSRAVDRHVG